MDLGRQQESKAERGNQDHHRKPQGKPGAFFPRRFDI
jgi:hypothetical protein